MQLILTVGFSLVVSALAAAGPMALLMLRHPSRGSATRHRVLHRAAIGLQLVCFVIVLGIAAGGFPRSGSAQAPDVGQTSVAVTDVPGNAVADGGAVRVAQDPGNAEAVGGQEQVSLDETIGGSSSAATMLPPNARSPQRGYMSLFVMPAIRARADVVGFAGLLMSAAFLLFGAALMVRQRVHERSLEQEGKVFRIGAVRIVLSTWAHVPWSSGLIRPRIHISRQDAQRQRTRTAVLAHELHHIRRHDGARTLGEMLLRALFWANPAIHQFCVRGKLLREIEADRAAAERVGHVAYPRALCSIAGRVNGSEGTGILMRAGAAATMVGTSRRTSRSQVRTRIERLANTSTRSRTRLSRILASVLLVGLSALVIACSTLPGGDPPEGMEIYGYHILQYDRDGILVGDVLQDGEENVIVNTAVALTDDPLVQVHSTTVRDGGETQVYEVLYTRPPAPYSRRSGLVVPSVPSVENGFVGQNHSVSGTISVAPDGSQVQTTATISVSRYSAGIREVVYTYFGDRMMEERIVSPEAVHVITYEYAGERCTGFEVRDGDEGEIIRTRFYEYDGRGRVIGATDWVGGVVEFKRVYAYRPRTVAMVLYRRIDPGSAQDVDEHPGERFKSLVRPLPGDDPWVQLFGREDLGVEVDVHEEHAALLSREEARELVRRDLTALVPLLEATGPLYDRHALAGEGISHSFLFVYTMDRHRVWNFAVESSEDTGLAFMMQSAATRWAWSSRESRPMFRITLPVTYTRTAGGVDVIVHQDIVHSVNAIAMSAIDPDQILGDQRATSVDFTLTSDGTVEDPFVRATYTNVNDPSTTLFASNDWLWDWKGAAMRTVTSARFDPTGLDAPVNLTLSVRRIDGDIEARLWSADADAERWLLEEYGRGTTE